MFDISNSSLRGWSSAEFLVPYQPGSLDAITQIAASSAIAEYDWNDRGVAPTGYIKGMALSYARAYLALKANDPAAAELSKARTGDESRDALAWYQNEMQAAGLWIIPIPDKSTHF